MEREKIAAELSLKDREVSVKEADAGMRANEVGDLVKVDPVADLAERMAEGNNLLAAQIQSSNDAMVEAMTAPKEVIRDSDGRPIGVQTKRSL